MAEFALNNLQIARGTFWREIWKVARTPRKMGKWKCKRPGAEAMK